MEFGGPSDSIVCINVTTTSNSYDSSFINKACQC